MMADLQPTTPAELSDAVRSAPRVIPAGGGTKPRLSRVAGGFTRISTAKLTGIIEYEPSEFTFTAFAGTPVRAIEAELAARGQYLPFDPVLVDAGATLGGTVAAGISGSGRVRYGGLRDFILGVRFVDGGGRLLRMGGRVVKNAAGFDLPKFFVGSAGRFGVLAELSFKVFPRPVALRTLQLEADDSAGKTRLMMALARGRWEVDALDAPVGDPGVYVRLGGAPEVIDVLAAEILRGHPGRLLDAGEADRLWRNTREFGWAHPEGTLVRVALSPHQAEPFATAVHRLPGACGWMCAGGNVGYVSVPDGAPLPELPWPAMTLRGDGPLWAGPQSRFDVMNKVKAALDPSHRFPGLDD